MKVPHDLRRRRVVLAAAAGLLGSIAGCALRPSGAGSGAARVVVVGGGYGGATAPLQ